jgi:hypothetical protein
MTITISVSTEAETKLKARAAASGTDVSHYAAQVVERAMASEPSRQVTPITASLAAWERFVTDMTTAGEQLPPGTTVDDSRDSIYAGRGE